MVRKIIRIDEEKCNGCGLCAEASCAVAANTPMNETEVFIFIPKTLKSP